MAVIRHFLRDTQTNAGTGGIVYDLSSTQGTPTTLSTTLNSATYTEVAAWQITVDDTVNTTSFPTSISISSLTGTLGMRWRIQRVNSSNVVQASSSYSSIFSATGTHTDTLTLSTTWTTDDRLRLSFEIARTGGHGTVDADVDVNNTNSYVDIDIASVSEERIFATIID
jgi:hypothetical protein